MDGRALALRHCQGSSSTRSTPASARLRESRAGLLFVAVTELLEEVERVRVRASDLRGEAHALRAEAAQTRRRSQIARIELDATAILRSLERFGVTLPAWNGVAPTAKEMTQWFEGIESDIASVESRLVSLRPGK